MPVDRIYKADVDITGLHHMTHRGRTFSGGLYAADIADNATIDLLLRPSKAAHVVAFASSSGNSLVATYESPTYSDPGAAIVAFNRNRYSSRASSMLLSSGPTMSNVGTMLGVAHFLAGGRRNQASGGQIGDFNEIVMREGLSYLIRLTNLAGAAAHGCIIVDWYEP